MTTLTYHAGTAHTWHPVEGMIDALADQLLADGDVERALQRAFRLGSEDEIGLLDVLDRLREEEADLMHDVRDDDQHGDNLAAAQRLQDTRALRDALRQVESLDDLRGLDPELVARVLTPDEREWIDRWADMTGRLIEAGMVVQVGESLRLSARAVRRIGTGLLRHMYVPPQQRGRGSHAFPRPGLQGAAGDSASPWEWGRPLELDVSQSLVAAIARQHEAGAIQLRPEDFVVRERESGAAHATALLLDMSRSMDETGAWSIARRAAIALNSLIETRHRHDHLDLIGFSGTARRLDVESLPGLSWDQFSHGTNLHAGLLEAQRALLPYRRYNRQIVIVTDGEPTAYLDGNQPVFEHPVSGRTLQATLQEARRAARAGIRITMIAVGDAIDYDAFARDFIRVTNGRLLRLSVHEFGQVVVRDIASGRITVM